MSISRLLVRPSRSLLKSAVFVDSTWFMPGSPRNPSEEWKQKRIPGSRRLDLDQVASSHHLGLKHMMPSPELFASTCGTLGIARSSHVVLYDTHGIFSSPRALFMFRAFGHENSSVLDGGLPAWEAGGLPLENGTPESEPSPQDYPLPEYDSNIVASYTDIVNHTKNANNINQIVLDARSPGRFHGTDPEPRPGLSSGHMPHSVSLPFNVFLRQETTSSGQTYTSFLSAGEVKDSLTKAVGSELAEGIITGKTAVITSCGSGMTAGILWLGLRLLDVSKIRLYDESWTGYALQTDAPILKTS